MTILYPKFILKMRDRQNLGILGLLIGLVGILAVILGAFGAHTLKAMLSEEKLMTYNTGVTYHFYHLFAMAIAWFSLERKDDRLSKFSFWCFFIGIILFSGSIYLLATRDLLGLVNYKWLGPLTPLGGVFFIFGWFLLGLSLFKKK